MSWTVCPILETEGIKEYTSLPLKYPMSCDFSHFNLKANVQTNLSFLKINLFAKTLNYENYACEQDMEGILCSKVL